MLPFPKSLVVMLGPIANLFKREEWETTKKGALKTEITLLTVKHKT